MALHIFKVSDDRFEVDGSPSFVGSFSGRAYYVDGNDGSDTRSGRSWGKALETIQAAIDLAGERDRIYIKAFDIDTGGVADGSAQDPPGYTDDTLVLDPDKNGLQLIGVGSGCGQMAQPCLRIGATTTAPLLNLQSCGVLIHNLTFNGAGATGGGIKLSNDGSTMDAGGFVISQCHFKNCKSTGAAATGGAVYYSSYGACWYGQVIDCDFYDCRAGIVVVGTGTSVPRDLKILRNRFHSAVNTTVDCDLYLKGGGDGVTGLIVADNVFGTVDVPAYASSPSAARYTDLTGCKGVLANNRFACTGKTFGAAGDGAKIPTTVRMPGNWQEDAIITRT